MKAKENGKQRIQRLLWNTLSRGDPMGYRIDYQSVSKAKKAKKRHLPFWILSACLLAVLLLNTVLKDQRSMLIKLLFPGDAAVTMASLENMLTQLKAGAPFQDALLVFCRQVIAG